MLENGADIAATNKNGDTILNIAARTWHTVIEKYLNEYAAIEHKSMHEVHSAYEEHDVLVENINYQEAIDVT